MFFVKFLFFLVLLLFVGYFLVKHAVIRFVRKALSKCFGSENYSIVPDNELFNFKHIEGKNDFQSLVVDNFYVKISFFGLFDKKNCKFIQIYVDQFHFEKKEKKKDDKAKMAKPFKKWIWNHLTYIFFILFIKYVHVEVRDVNVCVKGLKLIAHKMSFNWMFKKNLIYVKFLITELSVSKEIVMFRIPILKANLSGSLNSFKYLLGSNLSVFSDKIQSISIDYDDGIIKTNAIHMNSIVPNELEAETNIEIEPINIYLPKFDFYTKQFNLETRDIEFVNGKILCDLIIVTRNTKKLLNLSKIIYHQNRFSFESIDADVPSTLIIDISLFKRFIRKNSKSDNKNKLKSSSSKLVIKSKSATINYILHDMHIVSLKFDSFGFENNIIFGKQLTIFQISHPMNHHLFSGNNVQINIEKPLFEIKSETCEFMWSNTFAQQTMFQEFFKINSFINKQCKGPVSPDRVNQPPLSKKIIFESKSIKLSLKKDNLSEIVSRSFEAKRNSMESLLMRKSRAIQIMSARKNQLFDLDKFDKKSKEILFQLYKQSHSQIPPISEDLVSISMNDFQFILDGTAIHNFQEGKDLINSIVKEAKDEEIGKISGGAITFNASYLEFSISKAGKLFSFDNFQNNGYFLKARSVGKTRKDFKYIRITCDDGETVFNIPSLSQESISFIKLNTNATKMYLKKSPIFNEWKQDWKLGTSKFRKKGSASYQKLALFDKLRIKFRFKAKMNFDMFEVGYIPNSNPYLERPIILFQAPKFNFKFNGKDFRISSSSIILKVLDGIDYKFFASLPKVNVDLNIISFNPNQKQRPVFIPINSFRVTDTEYDPFEFYRTYTFSIHSEISFGMKNSTIDLNLLNIFLAAIKSQKSVLEEFIKPPYFAKRRRINPTLSYFDIQVKLPNTFSIILDSISLKTKGKPIKLSYNTEKGSKLSVNIPSLQIDSKFNEQLIFKSKLYNFNIQRCNKFIILNIEKSKLEIHSKLTKYFHDILNSLNSFKSLSKKKPALSLPNNFSFDDFLFYYPENKIVSSIDTMAIKFYIDDKEKSILSNIQDIKYIQNANENGIKMHTLFVTSFNVITRNNDIPLFNIDVSELKFSNSSNYTIKYVKSQKIAINPTEEDFNFFIPAIKKYLHKIKEIEKKSEPSDIKIKPAALTKVILSCISINLIAENNISLLSFVAHNILTESTKNSDKSETLSIIINQIIIQDELSNDSFKMVLETPEEKFLSVKIKKARKTIMKCPIFQEIIINVSPFVIRINMPFLKKLAKFFPSSDEIRMLDLDVNEYEQSDFEEEIIHELDNTTTIQSDNENLFFCQNFQFHPFRAGICVRRKDQGLLSEFLDRAFSYHGFNYFDLFGTKDHLIKIVKKDLKWAMVRSLSSLLFKKKKRTAAIVKTSSSDDIRKTINK